MNRTSRSYRSQVGQIFEERYELVNHSKLPRFWVEVDDQSPLPGAKGSHVLTMIGGREVRTYLSRTRLFYRGVYPLGPTVLKSSDFFGLFSVEKPFKPENKLLVLPHMVNVHDFYLPPGYLPGGEALRRRTTQITSNAAGVREYEPGDPLNRIHWISTARRDRLMVKEFELDPLADVWIFIDALQSIQAEMRYQYPTFDPRDIWGRRYVFELPPSTIEYAVTVSASLARYYIQRSRSVGMVVADKGMQVLPAERGGRQLNKILEMLALVKGQGEIPMQWVLEAQARHITRGSTVVIITPSVSVYLSRAADMLVRRGLRLFFILLESKSFGGSYESLQTEQALNALGVPFVTIRNGDNLEEKLSMIAGRRSQNLSLRFLEMTG